MDPTAVLMLSRELEQDRRLAVEGRRHRLIEAEIVRPARDLRRSAWKALIDMLRMPRFGPAR